MVAAGGQAGGELMEEWYRYEDVRYAPPVDEFDNPIGHGTMEIKLRSYPVDRHTPKGVWILLHEFPTCATDRRFVRTEARKQYACPTKELAMVSFIARKKRQAAIHRAEEARAEEAIAMAIGSPFYSPPAPIPAAQFVAVCTIAP